MKKTVLITGASTGFGKLIAKKFQQEGWNVAATMRSPEKETELNELDNVLVTKLDVTDKESINSAVSETVNKFSQIDVLVNNAGYGLIGALEPAADEDIRRQMDVNYFGLIDVTKGVLPQMRQQKDGTIINVSSVGGRITFPYISMYHASKFAVEGLSEALQYELNPLGIKVKLVEPGAYATDFGTRSMSVVDVTDTDYEAHFGKFMAGMQGMMEAAQDPQEVADVTYSAATDNSEQLRYISGADAVQMLEARNQMDDVSMKNMIVEQMGL